MHARILIPLTATLLLIPNGSDTALAQEASIEASADQVLQWNDNLVSAGRLIEDSLLLDLDIVEGRWLPGGPDGPELRMLAFAEAGRVGQAPGPLVRVRAGTALRVRIRNQVDEAIRIWGFQDRPFEIGDSLEIMPGDVGEVQFRATNPGTHYYWGRTASNSDGFTVGYEEDAVLSGALIVDPASGPVPPDRIFVFNLWENVADSVIAFGGMRMSEEVIVVNGRYWPQTERLSYAVGDSVRWRMINAAPTFHQMHLHGFHFRVDSRGTANADSLIAPSKRHLAVTELMQPRTTLSTTWVPKRVGNWLFHCHFTFHMMPTHFSEQERYTPEEVPLPVAIAPAVGHVHAQGNHASEGMGGMVVGIHVRPGPAAESDEGVRPIHRMTLLAGSRSDGPDGFPRYGYALQEGDLSSPVGALSLGEVVQSPGPTIILTRGEPTQIEVVNRLPVPTTVHWHGLEIDSYFDGIGDWSGIGDRLAPVIEPGESFSVLIRPVRAGTFMYHSHVNEAEQLALGLYGAIVILEPGEIFDEERDLVFVFGEDGMELPAVVNGGIRHDPVFMKKDVPYRIRLVGITANSPRTARIVRDEVPESWKPVAKDGADLPPELAVVRSAETLIDVGETRDFIYTPTESGDALLEFVDFLASQPNVEFPIRIRE